MKTPAAPSPSTQASPNGTHPLLTFYGDDFTGSTDVLESLAQAGLRAVLFLTAPSADMLAAFPAVEAFGIAGGSRAMTPAQMNAHLPKALEALWQSGSRVVHYKICSTFDSSPEIGSIGHALLLAARWIRQPVIPLLVGSPALGRYVVFGNLFAKSGLDSGPSRLDRHPTMSRHPVTPMNEADLTRHLQNQVDVPVHLFNVLNLSTTDPATVFETWVQEVLRAAAAQPSAPDTRASTSERGKNTPALPPVILFDTLDSGHLTRIGFCLKSLLEKQEGPLFVVGSSAVEQAFAAARCFTPNLPQAVHQPDPIPIPTSGTETHGHAHSPIVVVSGSCSPVTARQIRRTLEVGFQEIALDPTQLLADGDTAETLELARGALRAHRSVVFHTGGGPEQERFLDNLTPEQREVLGTQLGTLLDTLLGDPVAAGVSLSVVCGGDTSTQVARALGIQALTFHTSLVPGSPVCRVHAPGRAAHQRLIIFKGGQNGRDTVLLDAQHLAQRSPPTGS